MVRTALLYLPAALVVALGWLRLEQPRPSGQTVVRILLLALVPALARSWRLRIVLAVATAALAAHTAFGLSILDARPFDGRHDFFGPLASRFRTGFLDFYDYQVPVDPTAHPLMHGVLIAAVFGWCLALGLAIASRRAFVAVVLLVVGAGWPATLLGGGSELQRGAFILAAALLLLAGLSVWKAAVAGRAAVAGVAVVLCALVASTSPAVAKPEFLKWQGWDFYTRPQKPVSVDYVWNSSYGGIRFPKKVTTVLKIKGPPQSLYWRATTLDVFDGRGWVEPENQPLLPPTGDPLLPRGARAGKDVSREEVTVAALRDRRLVGGSVPIGFRVPQSLEVRLYQDGTAVADGAVPRDTHYTSFSYAPSPTPAELADSPSRYPAELARDGYLDVRPGLAVPAFGVPDRDARIRHLFHIYDFDQDVAPYETLYERAKQVVGQPSNPYSAALALETWFRSTGGFTYSEHPGPVGLAPLADFLQTKRGYCQHFAGAMALMLRYLGIPARVATGFTSGTYDGDHATWTVTDHDAHMWVEAWFAGYGWLPFDPTPGRGTLSAAYTSSSKNFDFSAAARLLQLASAIVDPADFKQDHAFGERGVLPQLAGASADARRAGADVPPAAASNDRASLLRLLGLIALGLLAAIVLAKLVRRRSRFLTSDPRRLAGACRRELAEFLADQRLRLPASATLAEVGEAVRLEYPVDVRPFVDAATAARFGPLADAAAAARAARHELRALERQIRRELGVVERALGLVSLRSLGFGA